MAYQWTKTDAAAPERVLLIGLDCGDYDAEASMAELERLTDTAGGLVVGHTVQKRPAPEGATYIGSGLVESLAEFCRQNEVDLTVADGSLTPVQARNLERALGTAVIDRTALILDIFAARARSSEGKLQVELAQLQYRLPRLGGQGNSLSRLGGGIGTGEGLPQLLAEIDRLLPGQWARAALCIPFDRGDLTDRLHREGKVLAEDYTPAGTRLQVLADPALLEELRPYFI